MLDLIVFIVIINVIIKALKKKNIKIDNPIKAFEAGLEKKKPVKKKAAEKEKPDIMQKVKTHIYGTEADQSDLERYKKYIEVEQRTDLKKMAKEMKCTVYQVVHELRDLQDIGYFRNMIIDEKNNRIIYKKDEKSVKSKSEDYHQTDMTEYANATYQKPERTEEVRGCHTIPRSKYDSCGYMTMLPDTEITYMTMPKEGMPISYNTMVE